MWRKRLMRSTLWHLLPVFLISIGRVPLVAAAPGDDLLGLSLEEALKEFEQQGLRLYYSSDLVRASMRIESAPVETDPVNAVAEILAPHQLMLRRGLNDTWLVVRSPSPPSEPPTAVAASATVPSERRDAWVSPPIEELIVAASRYEMSRAQGYTQQVIGQRDLEYLPDVGDDAIRAVARLPGVASNGLSAVSHFRGGDLSETLVRLDGLRLYDPFHLRDFQAVFSAIDPRIVSSIDVYTGGFPAVYGDRLSGVVDVETITVEQDAYHEIGASFFNSSLLSSGRFADGRNEWIVSLRRSNLDILYDNFSDQPDRPRYSDVFAKLKFDVSDKLAVTANVLRAEDTIRLADDIDREEQASAEQLDTYAWFRLDHSLGPYTSGSTLLSRATIDGSRTGTSEKSGVSAGWLSDRRSFDMTTLQSDWSRLIGRRMLLDFGASISKQQGSYEYEDEAEFDVLFDVTGAPTEPTRSRAIAIQPHGRQYTVYTTLRVDWTQAFASDFGVRWHRQRFDEVDDVTSSPRVGLRYAISERSTIRASWGRFFQSQAINELQVSDGSMRFFPSQESEQFVIGFDRLFENGTILRLEAYEKRMSDLRPRYENLLNARVLLPELKPDRLRIAPRGAHARGIELAIEGTSGEFQWWTNLSRSRVTDEFDDGDVVRSWDQSYALNAGFTWETGKWTLSSAVIYRTGWPTSTVALDESAPFPTVSVPQRNNERLGAFGSLDVRLAREIELERSAVSVFFELANVTDRSNICCLEYEIGDEEDEGEFVLDEHAYMARIPSIGFLWKF